MSRLLVLALVLAPMLAVAQKRLPTATDALVPNVYLQADAQSKPAVPGLNPDAAQVVGAAAAPDDGFDFKKQAGYELTLLSVAGSASALVEIRTQSSSYTRRVKNGDSLLLPDGKEVVAWLQGEGSGAVLQLRKPGAKGRPGPLVREVFMERLVFTPKAAGGGTAK